MFTEEKICMLFMTDSNPSSSVSPTTTLSITGKGCFLLSEVFKMPVWKAASFSEAVFQMGISSFCMLTTLLSHPLCGEGQAHANASAQADGLAAFCSRRLVTGSVSVSFLLCGFYASNCSCSHAKNVCLFKCYLIA